MSATSGGMPPAFAMGIWLSLLNTKTETIADRCKNYLWINKSRKCVTYIRNLYNTAKIYGQKSYDIKNERFIKAVKCCEKLQYAFPICDDPSLIGYHITKMSFNKLGESNCLTQVRGREHVSRDVT
jgi:hypothetical protein